jgi:hypothetical protein
MHIWRLENIVIINVLNSIFFLGVDFIQGDDVVPSPFECCFIICRSLRVTKTDPNDETAFKGTWDNVITLDEVNTQEED